MSAGKNRCSSVSTSCAPAEASVEPWGGHERGREPVQGDGEDKDQEHPEPELGHRVGDEPEAEQGGVHGATPAPRAPDAHERPDHRRRHRGHAHEQYRRPQRGPDHLGDRTGEDVGDAELAPRGVAEVVEELDRERAVQPELLLDLVDGGGRRRAATW